MRVAKPGATALRGPVGFVLTLGYLFLTER